MLISAMLERSPGYLSLGTSGQYLQGSLVMGGHEHQPEGTDWPEEPPQGAKSPVESRNTLQKLGAAFAPAG